MYIADTAIIQTLASSRFKSGILRRVSLSLQRGGITLENFCYTCCNLHMHEYTTAFLKKHYGNYKTSHEGPAWENHSVSIVHSALVKIKTLIISQHDCVQ